MNKKIGLRACLRLGKRIYVCDEVLDYRRRYVFYVRCLLNMKIIEKHCDFFSQNVFRKKLLVKTPHFLDQVLRQVFYRNSNAKIRSKIIQNHLEVMEKIFTKELLKKLYIYRQRIILWKDEYNGKPLVLYMVFREGQQKEGCLAIELVYDSLDLANTGWDYGLHVYQIIFSLGKERNGERSITIGALQGLANGNGFIKELTKAYFGYRPKNLMIWSIRCFCEKIGVQRIYAVSNQGHYAMNHYRRDRKLKVNMNKFWEECGGKKKEKDFFEIPIMEKRKSMAELKTSKRALYRRRFTKMDEMKEKIGESLRKVMRKE